MQSETVAAGRVLLTALGAGIAREILAAYAAVHG